MQIRALNRSDLFERNYVHCTWVADLVRAPRSLPYWTTYVEAERLETWKESVRALVTCAMQATDVRVLADTSNAVLAWSATHDGAVVHAYVRAAIRDTKLLREWMPRLLGR